MTDEGQESQLLSELERGREGALLERSSQRIFRRRISETESAQVAAGDSHSPQRVADVNASLNRARGAHDVS